jgi:hypothetical protein
MSHAEFWGLELPPYRYWRISPPTLEVDIAAIKDGRRSTSVHSFVTPNKQMNHQSLRRVISYRFAMRTVLGGTVLALPLEHVDGKKSAFIFEFVVQAFLLEGRQQKEVAAAHARACHVFQRRPVFEQFRRFQVGRGRSMRHIDGSVLFQLNVIGAQKRDC